MLELVEVLAELLPPQAAKLRVPTTARAANCAVRFIVTCFLVSLVAAGAASGALCPLGRHAREQM
ncbi:hypothetical protein GCM10009599_22070 [Luteococcus peritonei]